MALITRYVRFIQILLLEAKDSLELLFWQIAPEMNCTRTWLPKTPIEHAEETWSGPNQTAARIEGTPRIKTCEMAATVWPIRAT